MTATAIVEMNVAPAPQSLTPEPPALAETPLAVGMPRDSRLRRAADILLGKGVTLMLAAIALALGVATFIVLVGHPPGPNQAFALVLGNLTVLLLLGAVLAGRLTRMWVDRRRGSAG